jgi:hypothetical protein
VAVVYCADWLIEQIVDSVVVESVRVDFASDMIR